jgi:Protein of unknown function (DUF935)
MVKKEKAPAKTELIVNDIRLISVDRTMKDIKSFRTALRTAESIYFPNRTRLYDLYEDVLLDGHLTGIIHKRIDEVLNKELQFISGDAEVEGMQDLLQSETFIEIMREIMLSKFWGVSGLEFHPGTDVDFKVIPRKHIRPEAGIISIEQSGYEGLEYKDVSNIFVIGKPRDFGLLLQCSVYAIYKKGCFADYAQYVELFGQPIRVAKYDAHDIKTKTQLKQVLDEAGSSLALMIPKQAEFEIMDGKTSNSDGQLQQRLKDSCNDEMSVVILANTETTTNSKGGSNAKSKEHGKQQLAVTKSDMKFLLGKLNSKKFLAILASYGLPVAGGHFKFEKEIDITALAEKVVIDSTVAEQVPIGDDYWYDTYGIPKPDNYDELKAKMEENKQLVNGSGQGAVGNEQLAKAKEQKPKSSKKPNEKDVEANMSFIDKLRNSLADFFAPAP